MSGRGIDHGVLLYEAPTRLFAPADCCPGVLFNESLRALGTIVASIVFGFNLGIIFSAIMVVLLAATVLYQTSNVLHHYQTNQDVAASLALFASFATLLWYVIRILMSFSSDD